MATTRISDNQIDEATAATITTLNFLNTNSEFKIPVGDTATRPGTPAIGMMRFNSENDKAIACYLHNGKENYDRILYGFPESVSANDVFGCGVDHHGNCYFTVNGYKLKSEEKYSSYPRKI